MFTQSTLEFKVMNTMKATVALNDVHQGIIDQIGPALDDEEAAGYASILIQTDPVEGASEVISSPERVDSTPQDGVEQPDQYGPALDDEDVLANMWRLLSDS